MEASSDLQARIEALLEKNRQGTLAAEEEAELDRYEQLDYFMTPVKIRARRHLKQVL